MRKFNLFYAALLIVFLILMLFVYKPIKARSDYIKCMKVHDLGHGYCAYMSEKVK